MAEDRLRVFSLGQPPSAVAADMPPGLAFSQLDTYAQAAYKRGSALREQRRLDEALAAFERATSLKPDFAEAHNSRGIVLANLGRSGEALAAFERAIALKPGYAEAHSNRGLVLDEMGRPADALAGFERALALDPDNARICSNRGNVLRGLQRSDEALASYDRAIALKADYAEAYYNRGLAWHELKKFDAALADFDQAIALRPGYGDAFNARGAVLQDLQRVDEALGDYERAAALMPDSAAASTNKAYCLLQMGRFEEGWRFHEWRKRTETPVGNRAFAQPLWLGGEAISGKTIFVHWEQGFGDTIQFCRYAELLNRRGARVVMSVQAPLSRLLRRSFPDVAILNADEVPIAFDFHTPMLSLPLAFGTTLASIPSPEAYIFADHGLRRDWEARLPPPTKPRIGAVWSGSAKHKNDRNRSIDLAAFAPLLARDAHWISLQTEERDRDANLLANLPQLYRYCEHLADFAETAALIEALDLVVTVDTGVAHLAGAMGKPVWILLPYNADWRWLAGRDDCPWYASARLFRQQGPEPWDKVVARVQAALADFVRFRR